jgi:Flp pilus assembly protein TadB
MANFRNNSSGLYLLLFFAIAMLMAVAMYFGLLYWMSIPVLLLSAYLFVMLPRYYISCRYALYAKLYEE